jgi:Ca2+/Na+ antiporter
LSFILDKIDNSSFRKFVVDLVILPIINILAPLKREKILLSLVLVLIFLFYVLKELKLEYLILAYLALAIFMAYVFLGFMLNRKNSLKLARTSRPYSSKLIDAISGRRKMSLEVDFEPEIEEFRVKEIKKTI